MLSIPLRHGTQIQDSSPTLDRLIPALGYTQGNVWVISNRANKLKSDASLEELELIASAVRARLSQEDS